MKSAIPNLDGLDRLAFREGVDIRPTLLRVLTDLYVQKPVHTGEEERHYTELALRLIDEVDISTRSTVARKLAGYSAAPAAVVRRLARDVIEVAEPVLKSSQNLTGVELLSVIQDFGPRYAAVIASRRPPLPFPSPVSTTPTGSADGETSLRPPDIPITTAVVDVSGEPGGKLDQVPAGPTPPDMRLGELFFAASSAERRAILTNLDQGVAGPGAADTPQSDAVRRLEAAALGRTRDVFIRELEGALRVPQSLARRLVEDAAGEPLLVAVKAIGMPSEVLLRVLLFLDPTVGESVPRVFDLAKLYDRFTPHAAMLIVANLRDAAAASRRTLAHQPMLWNDEAERGRRAAIEAARRPAGLPQNGRRDMPAPLPARRHGTT